MHNDNLGVTSKRDEVTKCALDILNKVYKNKEFPNIKYKLKKKAYFSVFYECGWYFYYQNEIEKAHRFLFKAIKLDTSILKSVNALTLFIKNFMPINVRSKEEIYKNLNTIKDKFLNFFDYIFNREKLTGEILDVRAEAYTNAYIALGQLFYFKRDMLNARYYLMKVLKNSPKKFLEKKLFFMYLKSFLGGKLLNKVSELK